MSLSVPFVIYQQVQAGSQFTKAPPEAGPERTLNGLIQKYPNRVTGGYFKFSDDLFFEVKRIVADLKDAASWNIGIRHQVTDTTGATETIYDSLLTAAKQAISFTVTGGADGTYTITINGVDYDHVAVAEADTAIALALQILVNADPNVTATVLGAAVTVTSNVAGLAFAYSSASTGDPITEAVVTANAGSYTSGLIRVDLVRQLLPTEAIVVETTGATQAMSCEVLAYPSVSNYSSQL